MPPPPFQKARTRPPADAGRVRPIKEGIFPSIKPFRRQKECPGQRRYGQDKRHFEPGLLIFDQFSKSEAVIEQKDKEPGQEGAGKEDDQGGRMAVRIVKDALQQIIGQLQDGFPRQAGQKQEGGPDEIRQKAE